MQPGTEGIDDEPAYEERSQEDVEKKAVESVAPALKGTFVEHRRKAEYLVKIHLDDEAWHQVSVKRSDVFN
jgi:hypothetical protein